MTADIINLRRVRKTKARAAKATEAEQNRAKFGRAKAERLLIALESGRAERQLDGVRLPTAANEAGFPTTAAPDEGDLDPGNVS